MKKAQLIAAFLLLCVTSLSISCGDTEALDPNLLNQNPGGGTTNSPAAFQVDFSGSTYHATTTAAIVSNGTTVISASGANGSLFTLMIPATGVGTYTTTSIAYTPNIASPGSYSNMAGTSVTGQVTITAFNTTTHTITGTFNFTGTWLDTTANLPDIPFTNGIFTNIAYTGDTVTNPPPTTGNPVFKVDYNGSTYTANSYQGHKGIGLIDVIGYRGTGGEYVGFTVYGTTPGTYTGSQVLIIDYSSDPGDNDLTYEHNDDDTNSSSATVVITEVDTANHTISGTFEFVGYGYGDGTNEAETGVLKPFTNGVFTDIPYLDTDEGGDTATSVVDGTPYDYVNSVGWVTSIGDFTLVGPDHRIKVSIDVEGGEGTFPLGQSDSYVIVYRDANGLEYNVTEGEIDVTTLDGSIVAGTFNFVVKNSGGEVLHTVTNGHFNINYGD